ncbi:MAG: hypothetical protein ACK5NT_03935 [Pyrinomonadaceae bacterium]
MDKKISMNTLQNRKVKVFPAPNERGFSLLDTIVALMILMVGSLGVAGTMTNMVLYTSISSKKTEAKQVMESTVESIFAARDLQEDGALSSWQKINNFSHDTPDGIFISGDTPVRQFSGTDGIYGTADDACPASQSCAGSTSANPISPDLFRRITIRDIVENGIVRKKRVTVEVIYVVGTFRSTESTSTIIANMPFN